MTSDYSENELTGELYTKPSGNPSINPSDLLSYFASTAKRASSGGIKKFYEELKVYQKIVWPRHKKRIGEKMQESFLKRPFVTLFSTLFAMGLPVSLGMRLLYTLATGEPMTLDEWRGTAQLVAGLMTIGYVTDKLFISPYEPKKR